MLLRTNNLFLRNNFWFCRNCKNADKNSTFWDNVDIMLTFSNQVKVKSSDLFLQNNNLFLCNFIFKGLIFLPVFFQGNERIILIKKWSSGKKIGKNLRPQKYQPLKNKDPKNNLLFSHFQTIYYLTSALSILLTVLIYFWIIQKNFQSFIQ